MTATKWILSMLGLTAPPIRIDDSEAVDLHRVAAAARQQVTVSNKITKSTLQTLESQDRDSRPEELAQAIERLPRSATHTTVATMLGRLR